MVPKLLGNASHASRPAPARPTVTVSTWPLATGDANTGVPAGTGFNTYAYMGRVGDYKDTHNYFIKVLVETGVLGFLLFLALILRFFWSGLMLHWKARDPLAKALGLGLMW